MSDGNAKYMYYRNPWLSHLFLKRIRISLLLKWKRKIAVANKIYVWRKPESTEITSGHTTVLHLFVKYRSVFHCNFISYLDEQRLSQMNKKWDYDDGYDHKICGQMTMGLIFNSCFNWGARNSTLIWFIMSGKWNFEKGVSFEIRPKLCFLFALCNYYFSLVLNAER